MRQCRLGFRAGFRVRRRFLGEDGGGHLGFREPGRGGHGRELAGGLGQ